MRVDGLLLAAGAGTATSEPEALLVDDRGSWLLHGVRMLDAGGCDRITVVVGARASLAVHLLDGIGVEIAVAFDWQQGQTAWLRAGLTGMDLEADAALVHHVGVPDVGPAVISRVLAAGGDQRALARASFSGRPGHPLLLGREHWPRIVASPPDDEEAESFWATHDHVLVECADLGILDDGRPPSTA